MKRSLALYLKGSLLSRRTALFLVLLFLLSGFSTVLTARDTMSIHPQIGQRGCTQCHTCMNPSQEDPCLFLCPRNDEIDADKLLSFRQGPDYVMLKEIEKFWEPVKFNHKLHAKMSQFQTGCTTCHHNSPTNGSHPACKECHDPSSLHENIKQPGLKGAYHRQCLGCHSEWTSETDCQICHASKSEKMEKGKEYVEHHVRACKEPTRIVYKAPTFKSAPFVTFFHNDHTERFGMDCQNCHENQPCVSCHYQNERAAPLGSDAKEMAEAKCVNCHNTKAQEYCHLCHNKVPVEERFNHSRTAGWALNVFHQELSCQKCHPENKPKHIKDNNCVSCHMSWNMDNFDHAIAGVRLSENHRELECQDCHSEQKYEQRPVCTDCHDDDIRVPDFMPGMKTNKG